MASQMVHFSVTTGAPALQPVGPPNKQINVTGAVATGDTGTVYLKLWWQGNTNIAPVLGQTAPNVTIPILPVASGGLVLALYSPLSNAGPCFAAVTKNSGDTDTTALAAGSVVTIFIE